MALPTFVGVTAGDVPHSSAALSVPLPTGIAAKDKMFLIVNTRASEAVGSISGWPEAPFSPVVPASGDYRLSIFERDATGTDTDPTVPDSGDHQIAFIAAFRSGTGALLEIKHSNTSTAAASTSLSFPTITTTGNDYLVLNAVSDDWDAQDATRYSAWANASLGSVTERYDGGWTTNGGGGLGLATGTKATAGAVSATTATLASSVAVSMATFAIGDVAGAGTDALLANDVASGTPTVGTPAIGQVHGLAANDVASGTPSVSTPALGQTHALLANAGVPDVSSPALGGNAQQRGDDAPSGRNRFYVTRHYYVIEKPESRKQRKAKPRKPVTQAVVEEAISTLPQWAAVQFTPATAMQALPSTISLNRAAIDRSTETLALVEMIRAELLRQAQDDEDDIELLLMVA